jgi:hypothetical protein
MQSGKGLPTFPEDITFHCHGHKNNFNLTTLFGCQYSVLLGKGIQRDKFMSRNICYSIIHTVYDRTQGNICHVSASLHFCFVRMLSRYSVHTVYIAGIKC